MSAWDAAADLLIFYMRQAWEAAGKGWDSDNSTEMRNLVDKLAEGAQAEAAKEMEAHYDNAPHIYADGSTA